MPAARAVLPGASIAAGFDVFEMRYSQRVAGVAMG